ncbi:MAG: hypothetical protein WC841_05290 [Candidatus Shapirobacteria bacterium]|jgi:hypothetical protein
MPNGSPEAKTGDQTKTVILATPACFKLTACLRDKDIGLCGVSTPQDKGRTFCGRAENGLTTMANSYLAAHRQDLGLLPVAAFVVNDTEVDLCTVAGHDRVTTLATLRSGRVINNKEQIPIPEITR